MGRSSSQCKFVALLFPELEISLAVKFGSLCRGKLVVVNAESIAAKRQPGRLSGTLFSGAGRVASPRRPPSEPSPECSCSRSISEF